MLYLRRLFNQDIAKEFAIPCQYAKTFFGYDTDITVESQKITIYFDGNRYDNIYIEVPPSGKASISEVRLHNIGLLKNAIGNLWKENNIISFSDKDEHEYELHVYDFDSESYKIINDILKYSNIKQSRQNHAICIGNITSSLKKSVAKPVGNNSSDTSSIQQIFYGAPGTGKSHEVKKITGELDGDKPNVFRTTFHPDTDYASFAGCYKPVMKEVKKSIVKPHEKGQLVVIEQHEEIAYEFVPQTFTDAYIYAYDHPEETTYLVIEEINRGNCAQIFGDLFQLLDRNENGVSDYSIKADKDLAKYLADGKRADGTDVLANKSGIKDGKLCLPANLHILATMNTSDQSLFPIDSAFKRRWDWEYVAISYTEPKSAAFEIKIDNGHKYSWVDFIKEANKRIFDLTQSEDKQMGNFFIKDSVDKKQFCSKVMFYLWNEVLKDEVENSKYFFYEDKGSNQPSKFTFTDVYGSQATEILVNFMKYLGVKNLEAQITDAQTEESPAEDNAQ